MKITKQNLLIVFMILQVFLDNQYFYSDDIINLIGFSPITIFRFLFVGILFLFVFFSKEKQGKKGIFIYGIIFLIYTIIHHLVSVSINQSVLFNTLSYNLLEEVQYLLRMILPMLIIYIVYALKLSKKEIITIFRYTTLCLIAIMLSTNVFTLAYKSYGEGFIKFNFFSSFTSNIDRIDLASKGWFNSANQIGGLIVLIIPIMYYIVVKYKNKGDVLLFLLLILSSFILGTRISTIGVLLIVYVLTAFYYIYYVFILKKMNKTLNVVLMVIVLFSSLIFIKAPVVNCGGNNFSCVLGLGITDDSMIDNPDQDLEVNREDYDDTCSYLRDTKTNQEFVSKLYTCEENLDFWENFIKTPSNIGSNNRVMEQLIFDDIHSKVESKNVNLFGMGRSRFLSAYMYLEKDGFVHYYTIGVIGIIILLLPYVLISFFSIIRMLINKKIDVLLLSVCMGLFLTLLVSIISGHILDELIVTMYMGVCCGFLLNREGEGYE